MYSQALGLVQVDALEPQAFVQKVAALLSISPQCHQHESLFLPSSWRKISASFLAKDPILTVLMILAIYLQQQKLKATWPLSAKLQILSFASSGIQDDDEMLFKLILLT